MAVENISQINAENGNLDTMTSGPNCPTVTASNGSDAVLRENTRTVHRHRTQTLADYASTFQIHIINTGFPCRFLGHLQISTKISRTGRKFYEQKKMDDTSVTIPVEVDNARVNLLTTFFATNPSVEFVRLRT